MNYVARKVEKTRSRPAPFPTGEMSAVMQSGADGRPARRVVTRSHARIVGFFPSVKMNAMVPWESGIEADHFCLLETDNSVISYMAQPHTLVCTADGAVHRYTPDAQVNSADGETKFVEVKRQVEARRLENQERFASITAAYRGLGASFEVVTDEEIRREPRLSNAKLLLSCAAYSPEPELRVRVRQAFTNCQPRTLGELEEALGGGTGFRRRLFAMSLRGAFDLDLVSAPLSSATAIRRNQI